ncbi:MAG: putative lipid II flippase FtsW [Gammaproteobacteria bacterium]
MHKTDAWLVVAAVGLLLLGLLMVSSASIVISERQYHSAFHYLWRQVAYLGLGVIGGYIVLKIPTEKLEYFSPILLMFAVISLILVLIPGLGREVNGSSRWLGFGFISIQVSEVAKLFVVLYMAGYLNRHFDTVRKSLTSFIKPMAILGVFAVLLLLEPDFGSTVVLSATVLGMLFLAGVRLRIFVIIMLVAIALLALLAISSPYRLARLTTFINPWQHQYGSGYQLTQSLIAFGRGGISGVGLGNSIQKWFYLPEAHTDFLFAVLAEELGLVGILAVLLLFGLLVYRGFMIGRAAFKKERFFNAYSAYGFSLWIALQALINMGVNAGLLPTKGLTLPFMSYGGSSLLVMCVVLAILLRIDFENKFR